MNKQILPPVAILWAVTLMTLLPSAPSARAASAANAASDANWTRFRGPNGSGISDDAFDEPITEKNIVWKVELPAIGHSSPVVWGDHVYVTCGDKETAKRTILCLNTADGSTLWKHEYDSMTFEQHLQNSYATSTPVVDELGVYICWTTPKQYTLLALGHDGKERWREDLGTYQSQWGNGTSPIIVDDLVVLTDSQENLAGHPGHPESLVEAFDHKTGKRRWSLQEVTTDKTASSTPCLFTPKDGFPELILTSKGYGMYSVDPKTGQKLWSMPDLFKMRTIGSPIVSGDLLIGTTGNGGDDRRLFAVKPGNSPADTPKQVYKLTKLPGYVSTPIVKDGMMFMFCDNGNVSCVKADTGAKIWTTQERPAESFFGSPVCAGHTLWCMSLDGKLVGVKAEKTYHLVSTLDLGGEESKATPAVAGGKMYLRTLSHLICVGKK